MVDLQRPPAYRAGESVLVLFHARLRRVDRGVFAPVKGVVLCHTADVVRVRFTEGGLRGACAGIQAERVRRA